MPSSKKRSKASSWACPNCGWKPKSLKELREHLIRERTLTSMSLKGTITVTVLGIVRCPKCGKRYRVLIAKKKIDESEYKSPKERVIEIVKKKKRISLSELSKLTRFSERALRIALEDYVREGSLKGHFEGDVFVVDERTGRVA